MCLKRGSEDAPAFTSRRGDPWITSARPDQGGRRRLKPTRQEWEGAECGGPKGRFVSTWRQNLKPRDIMSKTHAYEMYAIWKLHACLKMYACEMYAVSRMRLKQPITLLGVCPIRSLPY
jgi:hypothetical protein